MRSSGTDVASVYYTWIITYSKKQRSIKRVIWRDYCSVFIREEAERDLAPEQEVVGSVAGYCGSIVTANMYDYFWMQVLCNLLVF